MQDLRQCNAFHGPCPGILPAMRLPDDVALRLLERWPVARLATLGEDGAPHLVPIVFAAHNARLWSAVDGKPKSQRPLVRA